MSNSPGNIANITPTHMQAGQAALAAPSKSTEGQPAEVDEFDVVELENEDGIIEFAILEELDHEGRHFAIVAPLAELETLSEGSENNSLSLHIFEVVGDAWAELGEREGDIDLAKAIMQALDTRDIN